MQEPTLVIMALRECKLCADGGVELAYQINGLKIDKINIHFLYLKKLFCSVLAGEKRRHQAGAAV